jgi:hypothetical protein
MGHSADHAKSVSQAESVSGRLQYGTSGTVAHDHADHRPTVPGGQTPQRLGQLPAIEQVERGIVVDIPHEPDDETTLEAVTPAKVGDFRIISAWREQSHVGPIRQP